MLYTLVSHFQSPRLKSKGIYEDSKSIQHNKPQSICTVDQKNMSRIDHSGPHTFLEVWHEEMARAESRAKKDPGIEPGQVGGTKSRRTSGQDLNVIMPNIHRKRVTYETPKLVVEPSFFN